MSRIRQFLLGQDQKPSGGTACGTIRCLGRYLSAIAIFLLLNLSMEATAWSENMFKKLQSHDMTKIGDKVMIGLAVIPEDLEAIRICRRTVDFASKSRKRLLDSEISFLEASALLPSSGTTPQVGSKHIKCIVARRDDQILATADCKFRSKYVQVGNVFVQPSERGQGLGRRIMMEGVDRLVAEPYGMDLCLCVYTGNTAAMRLYESCGYTPDGPLHAAVRLTARATGTNLMICMRKKFTGRTASIQGGDEMFLDAICFGLFQRRSVAKLGSVLIPTKNVEATDRSTS